jgi:hypothetical protein
MADVTEILTKLLERTNQDRVWWQTTADEDMFVATFGNISVSITKDPEGNTYLQILNKSGMEIERLTSWGESKDLRPELVELHRKAKRIALGTDSQLNELLRVLEDDF